MSKLLDLLNEANHKSGGCTPVGDMLYFEHISAAANCHWETYEDSEIKYFVFAVAKK